MATEDARYRQSSQFRLWSFTPSQLRDMRAKTNSMATTHISARLTCLASSAPAGDLGAAATPSDPTLPEFLTPAEESQLLTFYTAELLRAAAFIELPTDIRATAAIFLRRFYVTNSIMTYPPTELLKTALFFGSKAEGHYTRLARFAEKFPNTTPEEVLAGEFLLCQGIRFAFDVRHPFRALEGAIMDLRQMGGVDETELLDAHRRAREILKFSPLMTDAYFHYTPSQIMLAALSLADRGLVERILRRTFHVPSTAGEGGDDDGTTPQAVDAETVAAAAAGDIRDKVLGTIEACREMLATELPERATDYWGTAEANKALKPLIKKLKKCRDPDRWDLVALQRAKREQAAGAGSGGAKGGGGKSAGGGGGAAAAETKKGGAGGAATIESDAVVFGDTIKDPAHDAKRRKVLDDPFGPALG